MKLLWLFIVFVIALKSDISGEWKNDLGSSMTIKETAPSSQKSVNRLTGLYQTAVGNAAGKYILDGYIFPPMLESDRRVFSFTVFWTNNIISTKSVTAWTGVYYSERQTLETIWILTSDSSSFWNATRIGQNTFHRVK